MKKIIMIAATAVLLTACGGDSTTTTPPATTPTATINVTNTSGGTSDITGSWATVCFAGGVGLQDTRTIETFSSAAYTLAEVEYTTIDGSCGGTATEVAKLTADVTIGSDVLGAGWIDGVGALVPTPAAQDGLTTLPNTPVGTQLNLIVTSNIGGFFNGNLSKTINVVDATVANNIALYYMSDDGVNGFTANTSLKAIKQ